MRAVFVYVLSFCLVCLPVQPAFAQAAQSAGEVTAQIPEANIQRPGETITASRGTSVLWDDLVETEPRGRVRITLDDGSILNVGSDSSLRVVRHDAQSRQSELTLTFGEMRVRVQQLDTDAGQSFEVRTNTAALGVIGTDFYVFAGPTRTIVIVYEGVVLVQSIAPGVVGSVQVFAGQQTVVNSGQPPAPPSDAPPGQVQDSVQQTNVGEDLPQPELRAGPEGGTSATWSLIAIIGTIAVLSIVLPIALDGEEEGEPPVLPEPPPQNGNDREALRNK